MLSRAARAQAGTLEWALGDRGRDRDLQPVPAARPPFAWPSKVVDVGAWRATGWRAGQLGLGPLTNARVKGPGGVPGLPPAHHSAAARSAVVSPSILSTFFIFPGFPSVIPSVRGECLLNPEGRGQSDGGAWVGMTHRVPGAVSEPVPSPGCPGEGRPHPHTCQEALEVGAGPDTE